MKQNTVNYEVSLWTDLRTPLNERVVVNGLSIYPAPTIEKEKENKRKRKKLETNAKLTTSKGIYKTPQNGTGSQDCTESHSSSTHTDFERLSQACLSLALSARAEASSESVAVLCPYTDVGAYTEALVYTLPIVFCTLYTLPIVFSPLYTDSIVYTLAIVVFSPPAAVLTPHRLKEFAESSTTIFAMSLPNRAIGFRVFDVTGFCAVDEVEFCVFNLIGICDVEMGFSCIVMRVSDLIGFCEKGFFCTMAAVGVGLCAIEAKVDVDDELEVIVLVISRKSRLEGRSVLRLACCDGVRLACCEAGKLACKLEWVPLDATTKLGRGLPVNNGTLIRCEAPWPVNKDAAPLMVTPKPAVVV